jgi:hypothetical protein
MMVCALLGSAGGWALEETAKPANEAVELKVANRSIMLFRATLLGESPATRQASEDGHHRGAGRVGESDGLDRPDPEQLHGFTGRQARVHRRAQGR